MESIKITVPKTITAAGERPDEKTAIQTLITKFTLNKAITDRASITLKGKGNYSGSITITGRSDMGYYGAKTLKFTILPMWAKWIFG